MERDIHPLLVSLEAVKGDQGLLRGKLHTMSLKFNHFIFFEGFKKYTKFYFDIHRKIFPKAGLVSSDIYFTSD